MTRYLAGLWLAFVTLFAATGALAQTAPSGQLSIGTKFVQGDCLETRASDNTLVINKCTAQPPQALAIDDNTGMIHQGEQCLTAAAKGQPLTLAPCADTPNQKWAFEDNGTLKTDSGLCADILNFGKDPGTAVIAWDCTATDNQKFFPTNVRLASGAAPATAAKATVSGQPVIASYFVSGRCLAITGSKDELEYDNCNRKPNQDFRFKGGVSGQIVQGDKCLTSVLRGEPLALKTCANTPEQDWMFTEDGTLRSRAGTCADILRFDNRVHASVIAWECAATDNQKWYPAVAVKAGTFPAAPQIADALSDGKTATVALLPGFSLYNLTGSGGKPLGSTGGKITGGGDDIIVAGGAGVQLTKFGGLAGGNVKTAGATSLLPGDWGFFSGASAGTIGQ